MGRETWATVVFFVCLLSFLVAYVSVTSVWTPNPQSNDVTRAQNANGEYEGVFLISKLSYPLFLNVYHTPFRQQTFNESVAYGQVLFSVFLANAKIIGVTGTFSYPIVMGSMPLDYQIDFYLPQTREFFGFLLTLFTFLDIAGALLGIGLAKILNERIKI